MKLFYFLFNTELKFVFFEEDGEMSRGSGQEKRF